MIKRRILDRSEEYICFDSFVQYLREIDNRQKITYRKESKDPPDFWVTIEGITYAVEVTSIGIDHDYDALCKKLVKDIRSECVKSNDFKGKYALCVMRRPNISKAGSAEWRTLVLAATTKIREMSNVSYGVKSCLLKDANGYLEIEKWFDQGAEIGLFIMKVMKWEGEVQEELSRLIKKRIETKHERLKDVLSRCSNIILLIYDAFGYGEIEDIQKAFLNFQGYEWLHSIYLAMSFSDIPNKLYTNIPGRKGVFLYSKNKQWL